MVLIVLLMPLRLIYLLDNLLDSKLHLALVGTS
jgi:hypothetical protein